MSQGGKDIEKRKVYGKIKCKGFMSTYRRKKNILGQAFGICKSTSELEKLADSMYVS